MPRNLEHRNYGLGNRNMVIAGKNALTEGNYSYKTIATHTGHFRHFVNYVQSTHAVKDLKQIGKSHVLAYANTLKDKITQGKLVASTAQNYVSAVNTVLASHSKKAMTTEKSR
jgi:hypothetical protein